MSNVALALLKFSSIVEIYRAVGTRVCQDHRLLRVRYQSWRSNATFFVSSAEYRRAIPCLVPCERIKYKPNIFRETGASAAGAAVPSMFNPFP